MTCVQKPYQVWFSFRRKSYPVWCEQSLKFLEIKSASHQMKSMSSLIRFYVYILDTSLWRRKEW